MRFGYKLLVLLLVSLFLVSSAQAAVIAGVTLFHGDNFTSSIGGTFMLYGSSPYTKYNAATDNLELFYKSIIISSTIDDSVTIRNGTCESTKKYVYCYKASTIDVANSRTYRYGDYLQPMMTVTIESIPSPIAQVTFTRESSLSAYCGDLVTVPIMATNSGGIDTNITYTEFLPFNTVIMSTEKGRVDGNIITFKDTVIKGTSRNYSYVMLNSDCEPKNWSATYTFTTYNDTLSRNLTNLNLVVPSSYQIETTLSKNRTNNPKDTIVYTWTINNTHPSSNLGLDISLSVPGAIITEDSKNLLQSKDTYKYVGILPVNSKTTLYLEFHEPNYGEYLAHTNGLISIGNHVDTYTSNKTLQVLPAKVETYLTINITTNTSLYVGVWVKNYDITRKYYYIYGILKGLGEDEPFYANGIDPDANIRIANKFYNTTGMGVKEITFVFDGIYRDIDSIEHPIHSEQKVLLNTPQALQPNATGSNIIAQPPIPTVTKVTTPVAKAGNTTTNSTVVPKKDFITRVIEGLSKFLQSIFG